MRAEEEPWPGIQILTLGSHTFLEVPGEVLRQAASEAVVAASRYLSSQPFDVAVRAKRGLRVLTTGHDEESLAVGVIDAYRALGASSTVVSAHSAWPPDAMPLVQPTTVEVRHETGTDDLRYDISIECTAVGGVRGHLFQETKATLNPESWADFICQRVLPLLEGGPQPRRFSLAVGGTSAEASLRCAERATWGDLDDLPCEGDGTQMALRVPDIEEQLHALLSEHSVNNDAAPVNTSIRVVRLVRHGGSLPIGLHIGHPSDRRVDVTITERGVSVAHVR